LGHCGETVRSMSHHPTIGESEPALPGLREKIRALRADFTGWRVAIRNLITSSRGGPPSVAVDRLRPFCIACDGVWMPDDGSVYVSGWIWDPTKCLDNLHVLVPGLGEISIHQGLLRVPRPDVNDFLRSNFSEPATGYEGFASFITHAGLKLTTRPFRLRATFRNGDQIVVSRTLTRRDPDLEIKHRLLANVKVGFDAADPDVLRDMRQTLATTQAAYSSNSAVEANIAIGAQQNNPEASIVITQSHSADIYEAQVACLSEDPYLKRCEVVYVLDTPELYAKFQELAPELDKLYDFPMRLVFLRGRCGRGAANNAATKFCHSPHLVFMGPEIFPVGSGWIQRAKEFHACKPACGTVGAKVRNEDDGLTHAGIYFSKDLNSGKTWRARRYFEGLPQDYDPANAVRTTPAVGGGFLMLTQDHLQAIGGWDETYFLGIEEADLCIRAHQKGLSSWYLPSIDLYDLGSGSNDLLGQARGDLYGSWLLTERWDAVIEEMMGGCGRSHLDDGSLPVR
jgi:GT2 family glycosyltransferase